MARSEYTRLRDIAQKRLGRLISEGLAPAGLAFPKLREMKTEAERFRALADVQEFLASGTKLREIRESGKAVGLTPAGIVVDDPARLARNARQRERRRERREALQPLTKQQRSMIKGARSLGVTIKTPDIPAFIAYMEYRFSQFSDSRFYLMADYVEDFQKLRKKNSVESIVSDFARFKNDYEQLHNPVDVQGYSASEFQNMWNEFIKS